MLKEKLLKVKENFLRGWRKQELYMCEVCGKEFKTEREWFIHQFEERR